MAKNSRQRRSHRQRREEAGVDRPLDVDDAHQDPAVSDQEAEEEGIWGSLGHRTPPGRYAPLPQGSVPLHKVCRLRRRIRAKFSSARRTLFPVAHSQNRATILTLDLDLAVVSANPDSDNVVSATRRPLQDVKLHRVHPLVRQHQGWVKTCQALVKGKKESLLRR
ncbi:uncharacterized protein LOC122499860 [Leptopilina heterotoma]|uniref:uncharacterized protein LOC122499860 n=1 Tax=Leptopilina heterotoma TaxID=63436 RepID=UPI001CA7FA61|nr:uncharacterized protein LOC122499860 [Leptopilina heterotoma]XP_043464332.1 uncharacterized protein LOC122499860 [Leptopilina heterotoma]XP_043464333.1 uncharacterized protein LOC122499860 [Leptopilina heterotoma]